MQRIDVTQAILDLTGEEIKQMQAACQTCGRPVKEETLTLREACRRSLVAMIPQEKVTGDEKFKRYHLALKIMDNDQVTLEAKELVMVKDCIAAVYNPLVMGRAWELLDPPVEEDKKAKKE